MAIANLPSAALSPPIVPLAPRTELVVEPAAVSNMLNAFGQGQAVVQRAGQNALSIEQAANQMDLANRALNIQEAHTAQSMAANQAQMQEFLSPEQVQARRSAALVQTIQAKELEESAPERRLLDHYTRRAAISAAIAAPGDLGKKVEAILLHGGDTGGYDPNSLLPPDPQTRKKIENGFSRVVEYGQWKARLDAVQKGAKRQTRTLVDLNPTPGKPGKVEVEYYETPEGTKSKEEYETLLRESNMDFNQWMATPDRKEKLFGTLEELAKSMGLTTKGSPPPAAKSGLGEVDPATGGVVTEVGQKPAEPTADMLNKVDAAVSSAGDLIRIAASADRQQQTRWLGGVWAPVIPDFIRQFNPYDMASTELSARINGMLPQAARGIFGEVGVLTNADMDRYRALLPKTNSPEQRTDALLKVFAQKIGDKLSFYNTAYPDSPVVQASLLSQGFTPEFFASRKSRVVQERGGTAADALARIESGSGNSVESGGQPVARTATGEAVYRDPATGAYYKLPTAPQILPVQ